MRRAHISLLALISFLLLLYVSGVQVNAPIPASSNTILVEENRWPPQETTDALTSRSIEADQTVTKPLEGNITRTIQGGRQMLQFSSVSSSPSSTPSFTRHIMCKDFDGSYNPIDPTTIFWPSDTKAVCLTTVSIDETIEFRWYYRSNSSKTWVSCLNRSRYALSPGNWHHYEGHFLIAGYWPGSHYPRAYKVEVYLDGTLSFSEFFEVTNGGLNSPRICEDVDVNGDPVSKKSRFTIGVDAKAHHYLRLDKIAYFNEELGGSHNFTTVWIQPDGSTYRTYSGNFTDYKDTNITWNYWKHRSTQDDYIMINSSTAVGNWRVKVYVDSYFNNTWMRYGPIATTRFTVGSESAADWTFMVYLDADNSLEAPGVDIFVKMASVGSTADVNIVVQFDRTSGWRLWNGEKWVWQDDSRYGNWTDCKRFYITKGLDPMPENAIENMTEVNMGHPDTLRNFVNWTIHHYPANYYFLVLWNHGVGCMGLCFDNSTLPTIDFLSLPELSQALSGLSATMDVMLLDACSMSMTETAYQTKDYANVLVGPEGLGYAPPPYDDYLSSLTSNPSMLPNAFAREVVTDYIEWCIPVAEIQNATMAATDVTKITSLMAAIDDFALKLKEKETPYHKQISLARNLTQRYLGPYADQSGYYIDLYNFAQLTYQHVLDEELQNAADQVMTTLESIIIIEDDKACPKSHGLSIFFPDEKDKYNDFKSPYEETTFARDISWAEFVKYDLDIQTSGCALTIQTTYPDIPVEVDEESYTTDAEGKIQLFVLPDSYTVNLTTTVLTGPGSRRVFVKWKKDGDTSNLKIIPVDETLTLEVEYKTQYRLIIDTNYGRTDPDVGQHWYDDGYTFSIGATAPSVTYEENEQYSWLGWTGEGTNSYSGLDNPYLITMNDPINQTATWRHEYHLTVNSLFGSPTYETGWFEVGKSINISVVSPVVEQVGTTRYVCTGWNGTGSVSTSGATASVTVTINEPSSVTWNWKTQYLLTGRTDPIGLSLQPSFSPPGPWYDNGTVVTCTAEKIMGRVFDHWIVDGASWDPGVNSIMVTMNGPYEATAHYARAPSWWETLFRPESLQVILGLLGIVLTIAFVGATWAKTRRRRGVIKVLLDEIDEVYSRFKVNPRKCEEELHRMGNTILGQLTDGKITEESYNVLDKKIDKYLEELQSIMKARAEPTAIEVSEVLPGRITTGYADLDNLLFGGIPENYAAILTSSSCDERDLLIKRFLETGAERGDITFYVTIDPGEVRSLAEEYQSIFHLFICNPQADKIIESLPNVFKLKGVEDLMAISIALTKAFRGLDESITGPRRACIEIISDVLLLHHAVQTRKFLTELITELKSRGFTTLAVMNPQMHPPEESHAILDLFEGEINIYEKETEKGLEKFLKIKKMYNQRYLESELPLKKEKLETSKK